MSAAPILAVVHDVAEKQELFGTSTFTQLRETVRGFCYLCSGPVQGWVVNPSLDRENAGSSSVDVAYECMECGAPFYTIATATVLDHPRVVSLLQGTGIDYQEIPIWRIQRELDSQERLRSEDPVHVVVTVSVDDDGLTLVLDETLDVIEYNSV